MASAHILFKGNYLHSGTTDADDARMTASNGIIWTPKSCYIMKATSKCD